MYNPLARPVSWPVRLPVNGSSYLVSDARGVPVDSEVGDAMTSCPCRTGWAEKNKNQTCRLNLPAFGPLKVIPVSRATREVRRGRGFAASELVFQVQAPPLGFTTYTVTLLGALPQPPPPKRRTPAAIQNKVRRAAGSLSGICIV